MSVWSRDDGLTWDTGCCLKTTDDMWGRFEVVERFGRVWMEATNAVLGGPEKRKPEDEHKNPSRYEKKARVCVCWDEGRDGEYEGVRVGAGGDWVGEEVMERGGVRSGGRRLVRDKGQETTRHQTQGGEGGGEGTTGGGRARGRKVARSGSGNKRRPLEARPGASDTHGLTVSVTTSVPLTFTTSVD